MRQKVSAEVWVLSQNGYSWTLTPSVASVVRPLASTVRLRYFVLVGLAVEAHQVVPHRLVAGLRDRERETRVRALDRAALVVGLGPHRVLRCVVGHPFREGDTALRGVDVDAKRGVLLQQGLGALGEHGRVLIHVLGVDDQARLLGRVGVGTDAVARLEGGRRRRQAAGVGGNGPVLVGALLGADAGERGAERLGFFGRDGGVGGERGGGEGRQERDLVAHDVDPQKVVLKVRLTAPRSFRKVVRPLVAVTAVPLSL